MTSKSIFSDVFVKGQIDVSLRVESGDGVCVECLGGERVVDVVGNLSLIVDQNKNTRAVLHNKQTNSINTPQREV